VREKHREREISVPPSPFTSPNETSSIGQQYPQNHDRRETEREIEIYLLPSFPLLSHAQTQHPLDGQNIVKIVKMAHTLLTLTLSLLSSVCSHVSSLNVSVFTFCSLCLSLSVAVSHTHSLALSASHSLSVAFSLPLSANLGRRHESGRKRGEKA